MRSFRVYRPARLPADPGLVIDLHSAHTNGFLEELATRFDAQADQRGWIVAYPDGVDGSWEPYGCCHHDGVDDVAFIGSLIDQLTASDGVDSDRVYVTGLSRGGMMAYRVACELSGRVAAIAPVAGNMADASGSVAGVPCQPDRPVSVFAIHGLGRLGGARPGSLRGGVDSGRPMKMACRPCARTCWLPLEASRLLRGLVPALGAQRTIEPC